MYISILSDYPCLEVVYGTRTVRYVVVVVVVVDVGAGVDLI